MKKNPSLSLIITAAFFFHYLLPSLVTAGVTNITTDQEALLALKSHVTHDPNNLLVNNWSTITSVCNWIGITCGSRHRRITALNISYLNLTGTIPPQLGNLSFLSVLAFRNNSFYGSLPEELAHLRRLKYIDFSFNNFNIEIPSWFGFFPKLQHLYLKNNSFIGIIPQTLANLSSLQELNLSVNQLSGTIASSIFNISSLKKVDFSENQLSGTFPSIVINLPSLLVIDFITNRLSGEIPTNICYYLPNLSFLLLAQNMFEGQIPSTLSKCRHLQFLSLSFNLFTGTIPKEIGNMTKLLGLYLVDNKLQGEIPEEIGNLAELESLNLGMNMLTGTISRTIFNLSALSQLWLSSNNLTGDIPHEIGNLRNLEKLILENNNLVGQVPASIFNMSTLKTLALGFNGLSGGLPSSIDIGLPNLEKLLLASCYFSGIIPNTITNLSKLVIIELSNNSFSGFIPSTFGNLRYLQWLNLATNDLKSSTPDMDFLSSLASCKNLEMLQLMENPLNGILTSSFGNLPTSLQKLSLDNCNISGTLPNEIGNLKNLIVLGLGNNALRGSIPVTLGRLQKLQGLYLPNNKLTGLIPDDLCQLEALFVMSLSKNKLSGSIPACFGNLTFLRHLYISSNYLTSIIPSTLWKLKDTLSLNLSSNFLNGSIPLQIGNLKVVTSLDFSKNRLSGDIPATIGGLTNLQYLFLSDNSFHGQIPESMRDLKSLKYLDLSNNNISGVIPKSMEALLYLDFLNMSFNHLEGEILTKGSFAKFSAESFIGNPALCGPSKLQVSPCNTRGHQKSRSKIAIRIILPVSIVLTVLVFALILVLLKFRQMRTKPLNNVDMSLEEMWRRISYQDLYRATDGFSEDNLLGAGGFGSVYKGTLRDGMLLAVKVFHMHLEEAFKSFNAECEVMKNLRHRNLVRIISVCSNEDFKALILEFMPNGSLEKWLYSDNYFLDILQRINIMIDVTFALEYLHFGYSSPVIHCDLKPNNVLLDENMVARLSDFGIAKLLAGEATSTQTETFATIGYMAPEFGTEGKISRKCDVYGYGIMLMETFTKKKPTDEIFVGEMSLKQWVNDSLHSRVVEVVDANLLREDEHFVAKEECVSSILSLALECSRELPDERITIKEVASRLVKIKVKFLSKNRMAGGGRRSIEN